MNAYTAGPTRPVVNATDILFRVPIDGREGFLYLLIDHQSSIDRWMAWRLLRSMVLIWDKWRKLGRNRRVKVLPLIVPIVVCHGKKRWWAPLRFESLVGDPDRRIAWMQDKIPSFTYLVIDLTAMTNAQIVDLAASASLRLFLLIMKHIRDDNLHGMLQEWHAELRALLREPNGWQLLELLLTYLAQGSETVTEETLVTVARLADPSAEEMAMTLAEQLIDRGRKQGIEQGIERGIERGIDVARRILLKQVRSRFGEVPTWWEERVQSASADELETWSDRVLRARSIDEVVG